MKADEATVILCCVFPETQQAYTLFLGSHWRSACSPARAIFNDLLAMHPSTVELTAVWIEDAGQRNACLARQGYLELMEAWIEKEGFLVLSLPFLYVPTINIRIFVCLLIPPLVFFQKAVTTKHH